MSSCPVTMGFCDRQECRFDGCGKVRRAIGDGQSDEVQAFTPDESRSAPTTLADALRWINTTPERAWALAVNAKWGFSGGSDSPYEYDQGDSLVVDYDSLYDLADIALAVLRLLDPDLPDKGAAVAFLDDLQSNHLREVAESPSDGLGPESGGVS